MQPTDAELARTLATGRPPALAHISGGGEPVPVRHISDPAGRPLLLVADGTPLARRLPAGVDDAAIVLEIADVPPTADAPTVGRVWLSGWVSRLSGEHARAAALHWADADPTGDLLDVDAGQTLYRIEPVEIRLDRPDATVEVDVDDYTAATPDPLHLIEAALLADLADHHITQLGPYLRRQLGAAGTAAAPRIVRLDRYGMLVRSGQRLVRLRFPHPITDRGDLADLLHPVLCRRCHHTTTATPDTTPATNTTVRPAREPRL